MINEDQGDVDNLIQEKGMGTKWVSIIWSALFSTVEAVQIEQGRVQDNDVHLFPIVRWWTRQHCWQVQ